MSTATPPHVPARPPVPTPAPARRRGSDPRFGYAVAVLINAALLYLLNAEPGWQAVPFLTQEAAGLMGWVSVSLAVGILANLAYLAFPARWVRPAGEVVTSGIGLLILVGFWRVFPFDFGADPETWELLARWVIGVGIFGCALAVLVNFVVLVRRLAV